jgi:hypothetical protein
MAHSKSAAAPKKPRPDFPLSPRKDGRWCKRVNGKLEYFTGTADEALTEWLRVKDYLLAGRPRPPLGGYMTLANVINDFLHSNRLKVDSGERSLRT